MKGYWQKMRPSRSSSVALELASEASVMDANKNRVYAIAGDSHLKLGKFN